MKRKLPILTLLLICILASCSKNAPISGIDTNTGLPPKDSLPKKDSLPFPLTVGTWWKYQRLDTSVIYMGATGSHVIFDSSYEMITVTGKTKLSDSVTAAVLEVKNLSKSKTSLCYAFYYRNNFIISDYLPTATSLSYYDTAVHLKNYDMRFRLPLKDGKTIMSEYSYDSIYTRKDTAVTVLNKLYLNTSYTYEMQSNFYGAYGSGGRSKSLIGKNIGFLYWSASFYSVNHYGIGSEDWYTRRLMDYYIAP